MAHINNFVGWLELFTRSQLPQHILVEGYDTIHHHTVERHTGLRALGKPPSINARGIGLAVDSNYALDRFDHHLGLVRKRTEHLEISDPADRHLDLVGHLRRQEPQNAA